MMITVYALCGMSVNGAGIAGRGRPAGRSVFFGCQGENGTGCQGLSGSEEARGAAGTGISNFDVKKADLLKKTLKDPTKKCIIILKFR